MSKKKMYGSVSGGTMRPEDLIPAFLDTLEYFNSRKASGYRKEIPEDALENEDHEYWNSEDAGFLLDELFDVLNEYAPAHHYFGAHPGDGADYGFWKHD